MEFINTTICQGRKHCQVCRQLNGAKQWRQTMQRHYSLPEGKVDFQCPFGQPWVQDSPITEPKPVPEAPTAPPVRLTVAKPKAAQAESAAPWIDDRLKICEDCQHFTVTRNGCRLTIGGKVISCGGCYRKKKDNHCPLLKW